MLLCSFWLSLSQLSQNSPNQAYLRSFASPKALDKFRRKRNARQRTSCFLVCPVFGNVWIDANMNTPAKHFCQFHTFEQICHSPLNFKARLTWKRPLSLSGKYGRCKVRKGATLWNRFKPFGAILKIWRQPANQLNRNWPNHFKNQIHAFWNLNLHFA